jgi:UDP-GlcNAc:undecaprenyl-phosphate GlcNAc-1-phosphate transferase
MASDELIVLAAFLLAALITYVATPIVAALAARTGFYDMPAGYKGHARPTPYLGGLAVFAGIMVAASTLGGEAARFAPLMAGAGALLALGTLDDGVPVAPLWRLFAELLVAIALTWFGLGWGFFDSPLANMGLTALWVVGLVNAFNLMDNLDGAAGTVAGVCATGIGALALMAGAPGLAALAFAVAGASLAFLRYNLARPARIFLGDGGSMTLGLLIAGMTIAAVRLYSPDQTGVLGGAMLVGIPIFDTALVVVSRLRDRVSIVTAGRDHLTHRLLARLRSPRRVALALACAQGVLSGLAVAGQLLGPPALTFLAAGCVVLGMFALVRLDSPAWKPARPRPEASPAEPLPGEPQAFEVALEPPRHSRVEVL